jgi:DNA-binding response OmpR family regulator
MNDPQPLKVLMVDDDQDLLFLTASFIGISGALQVETVDSPGAALVALGKRKYDAVVCDYDMPMMNGIEVLKKIRERSDVPFILFTGKGREDVAIDALNNGADFYLRKGSDPSSLFGELEHMIVQATDRKRYKGQLQASNEGNVSERMRAEEGPRRSEAMDRSILDSSPDGIIVTDLDGTIQSTTLTLTAGSPCLSAVCTRSTLARTRILDLRRES